ncbi:MAG: NTP transferase domain-containing protein [Myxococcaceae bacterium]
MPVEHRNAVVAGVVLAAGTSSRMGRNKLLLPLGKQSVVRRAVETALAAGLEPLLVVLGHEQERVQAELRGLRYTPVLNPAYAQGINTSVRCGIAAVPAEAQAALVMLADMPFVTSDMVRTVVERYRAGTSPLVVSSYEGVDAPPMLYERSLFAELLALEGDGCGKRVVKRHRLESVQVPWPASALADLDVPADLDAALAELGGR